MCKKLPRKQWSTVTKRGSKIDSQRVQQILKTNDDRKEHMKTLMKITYFATAVLAFACLAFSPWAKAVSPPPDGGYPGFNTAEGQNALLSLDTSTGFANTALGSLSLQSTVDASFNTGVGAGALSLNTANENTAVGAAALLLNTTGEQNTAVGVDALLNNTAGEANTAIGDSALLSNTTGAENTANGAFALLSNTAGNDNTADGLSALQSNTVGFGNTATGASALFSNTEGGRNTANGEATLFFNTTGDENTASGALALTRNTTGSDNTANGTSALFHNTTGGANTGVGNSALINITTGSSNTALGDLAGFNLTTGDNDIDIGFNVEGVGGESNTIRIGNTDITDTFIKGISGTTVASGATVLVAANGHLGTVTSSSRFKEEIKPMDKASEALFSLKPVTFRYKKEIDPAGTQQFGLMAEDVEKISPDLVVRDENGVVNTVRYDQVNAMLLNEFLKEHRKVQRQSGMLENQARKIRDQETTIAELKKEMETVVVMLREQESQIQGVSAQIEMSKPATSVVLNNP